VRVLVLELEAVLVQMRVRVRGVTVAVLVGVLHVLVLVMGVRMRVRHILMAVLMGVRIVVGVTLVRHLRAPCSPSGKATAAFRPLPLARIRFEVRSCREAVNRDFCSCGEYLSWELTILPTATLASEPAAYGRPRFPVPRRC
jgi:hypothetical protein